MDSGEEKIKTKAGEIPGSIYIGALFEAGGGHGGLDWRQVYMGARDNTSLSAKGSVYLRASPTGWDKVTRQKKGSGLQGDRGAEVGHHEPP